MTSSTTPAPCRYDRTLAMRVTRDHLPDCPNPADHRGCVPCPEPHCVVCNREHLDHVTPQACPDCVGKIRADLATVAAMPQMLEEEAIDGGRDGRLVAAAPIPGDTAQVLNGPMAAYAAVHAANAYAGTSTKAFTADHPISSRTGQPIDPIPPLTVLARWEDVYRQHLGHRPSAYASLERACAYFDQHLTRIAQDTTGPDFLRFTRELRQVRAQMETALHDERRPESGVECFECGEELIRRFHDPARCTHPTPARRELKRWLVLGYPEALTAEDVRAARRPCGRCDQGGIGDPSPGMSWECPGCRKDYDPGDYANAVRRDLLTRGPDGDGWTHVSMAAEAASTLVGHVVAPGTVRQWIIRTDRATGLPKVASRLNPTGVRLVFWPDVADCAVEAARRADVAAARRRLREAKEAV